MATIQKMAQDLRNGTVSSVDLVQESIHTMQSTAANNAYISVLQEQALQQARVCDEQRAAGQAVGPLHGIPLGIKDNICIAGTRTTCGSKMLEAFEAPYDATVIARLKEAGAIFVGKTNMDEFAMGSTTESSYFGAVVNPKNEQLIPGGSSGGSAAAVACGSVPAALGSDTGGSIRQPAACCGVVGLKPTYGRVSRYGLVAYASSLDQIGPIATNVYDCALLLNAISGQDVKDQTSSDAPVVDFTRGLEDGVQGKVIGVPKEYFGEGLSPEVKDVIMQSLAKLQAQGAVLKEVSLPSMEYAISAYYIIATAEASSNLSRFDGVRYTHRSDQARTLVDMFTKTRAEAFGTEVKRRILLGTYALSSGFYDAYYVQAQKVRRLITNDFEQALSVCDVLAAPTLPGKPMSVGAAAVDPMAMYLSDIYTVSVNLAGLPGISVPCGEWDNTSVSLQLLGKRFDESTLLQIAAAV
jgi:aspartyl-tRNA(Asn)/glutamyl-tRNA(Gln) amidotransferase subunit A